MIFNFLSNSPTETKKIGKNFAKNLNPGTIVCFLGDLGSGKTTFIKGVIEKLINIDANEITSPTFNYLNIYKGNVDIYHFDLYRIKNEIEFKNKGFFEYFSKTNISLIEWPEKIIVPQNFEIIHIHIIIEEKNKRKITILKK